MSSVEAEDLVAHLCGGLAPDDRESFRQAAEGALATSPQWLGPGRDPAKVTVVAAALRRTADAMDQQHKIDAAAAIERDPGTELN